MGHILHALLEAVDGKLHLVKLKVLHLDGSLVLLLDILVSLGLDAHSLIFVLEGCQFRLNGTLLVAEMVQLLRHHCLFGVYLLSQLKHVRPGAIATVLILLLLLEVFQAFLQRTHIRRFMCTFI